ncbi:MAG: phosphatase PAP2 family protein [Acidobacteriia bacterium]|nr:phosphatase PAP2 family protein [Terriglobia bacterium]
MENPDYGIMRRIHKWQAPQWVRWWMVYATRCGDGWIWAGIGLAVLLLGGEHRLAAASSATLAALLSIGAFLGLKRVTLRTRPCYLTPHCWSTVTPPDQFSFPSGHAMAAFAVTVPLSLHFPDLWIGLFFCAVSVAASRIILGMHFLSDVLAGSLAGAALGYWCFHLFTS